MVRAKARELGPMDGRADGVAARRSLTSRAGVRRCVAVGLALVMVSGMAGCGGGDAGAGGTPSVSGEASVTPSVTPTPTPSEDPLFTEAKAVYSRYLIQIVEMNKRGGGTELPPGMKAIVSGEYELAMLNLYTHTRKQGYHATQESSGRVVRVSQVAPSGSHAVSIDACMDLTALKFVDAKGKAIDNGTLRRDHFQLDRSKGSLVIVEGNSEKVTTCDT